MNNLIWVIVIAILGIIWLAVRNANQNKIETCPRCNGEGYVKLGKEEEQCSRCRGSGQMLRHGVRHR